MPARRDPRRLPQHERAALVDARRVHDVEEAVPLPFEAVLFRGYSRNSRAQALAASWGGTIDGRFPVR
jgi:hypothetical protein